MDRPDFGLLWLQLALAHLDILLHRQMQRFAQTTLQSSVDAPLDRYFVSEAQVYSLLYQRAGYNAPDLAADDSSEYTQALATLEKQMGEAIAQASEAGTLIPFLELAAAFDLTTLEQEILLATLAPELDARYGKIYGYLNNDPASEYATVDLLIDLFAPPGLGRLALLPYFSREGALARNRLVELVEPSTAASRLRTMLKPDPAIASWLFGTWQPPALFRHCMTLEVEPGGETWMLSTEAQMEIGSAAGNAQGNGVGNIVVLHGRERLAKRAAAVLIAALADRPMLTVDLEAVAASVIGSASDATAAAVEFALRDARMTQAIPHVTGWEHTLRGDSTPARLQQTILDFPHTLILSSELPWQPSGVERARAIVNLSFPAPIAARRRAMLEHYLESQDQQAKGAHLRIDETDLTVLSSQFMLTGEQLRDVVYSASDAAKQARKPLGAEHLFAASRAQSSPALLNLAHKIEPRYDWDDLVLPADSVGVLREIVEMVRQRGLVLEEWGLGKSLVAGTGVATLFSGPPGTGKTMAASVLAKHLGLDLFKIDLSGVVSKYIGETEKNLERIFSEAEDSNAILFFDEADAIFGKRSDVSDAHDRHANIEVSYLLQRMESYRGVTILATNLRGNLDEAFFRRLQFVVDLPFPEYEDRLRIWQSLFPKGVPAAPGIDLSVMARRFRFAGGNIRNVLVSAAYQAAANGHVLTMEHLFHGARREMQKMGRMIDENDMRLPPPPAQTLPTANNGETPAPAQRRAPSAILGDAPVRRLP